MNEVIKPKHFTLRISAKLSKQFKLLAIAKDKSMQDYIIELIQKEVDSN